MKLKYLILTLIGVSWMMSCSQSQKNKSEISEGYSENFDVMAESFADIQVLRYEVPGFSELTAKQKELAYYLYEAALSGRDIIYDQKSKYGLLLRKTLETMYGSYSGVKSGADWQQFQEYCGRFWFSNGNHHHYGNEKFIPSCGESYFHEVLLQSDTASLPLSSDESVSEFWNRVRPLFFDLNIEPKVVDLTDGKDNVVASSNNFYEGVTQQEVDDFYSQFSTTGQAPSWGLNSKLMKENGKIVEKVYKSGGMYGAAIDKIIYWLQKASAVAENEPQRVVINKLIKFYQTGNLKDFDDYSIAWVADTASRIDFVNGFIEVYLDAIGKKGSFEAIVSLKDMHTTETIKKIAANAQWFEDNSPLMPNHKKPKVTGITAKAITTIVESGDGAPATAIGINLPNADWIRKDYGSKSVSLSNIVHSYNIQKEKGGMLDEFGLNPEVKSRIKKYGSLAADLHTDMHECIGHASGQINPGVGTTDVTLKTYSSCLEEARADLVGLYFIDDKKLIEIGVMPNLDVAKAEYDGYMMNGLMTQLTRIKLGDNLEEAHMRNRQLIAKWVMEKGANEKVVEYVQKEGKTYVKINNYDRLRVLFGDLLREIQRIKSEGDYKAGKALVENYGVKVDQQLHKEVLDRYAKLNLKPYSGFIQPRLVPIMNGGQITDVQVEYPKSFFEQMMEYGKKYSFLPVEN